MVIEVKHLIKHYGEIKAVDDVSFQVEQGEVFGMLGPNGAGKTTTVEIGDALRQVMVNATPLYSLTTDIAVLAAWLVVSAVLAIRLFHWE